MQFSPAEIHKRESELREIGEKRKDGQFVDENGNILKGSENISGLLDRCLDYTKIILEKYVTPVCSLECSH